MVGFKFGDDTHVKDTDKFANALASKIKGEEVNWADAGVTDEFAKELQGKNTEEIFDQVRGIKDKQNGILTAEDGEKLDAFLADRLAEHRGGTPDGDDDASQQEKDDLYDHLGRNPDGSKMSDAERRQIRSRNHP
jgi:hypothetical protein